MTLVPGFQVTEVYCYCLNRFGVWSQILCMRGYLAWIKWGIASVSYGWWKSIHFTTHPILDNHQNMNIVEHIYIPQRSHLKGNKGNYFFLYNYALNFLFICKSIILDFLYDTTGQNFNGLFSIMFVCYRDARLLFSCLVSRFGLQLLVANWLFVFTNDLNEKCRKHINTQDMLATVSATGCLSVMLMGLIKKIFLPSVFVLGIYIHSKDIV